ncbi:MAG TPA: diaminopimelate epimerase [Bacteroidia bacterium]|nr:diaminopimelate epimerase [Bacteroidia bacterium]HNT79755.1 diaminopimelate epimerase [Bacteroidia bacterium]
MEIQFYKYEGTGNDFVIIDDRSSLFPVRNHALVKKLCNRRTGIGADGLILIKEFPLFDFEMIYYNADGFEGSFCGNGSRCIVAFAHKLGLIQSEASFKAADGTHKAKIISYDSKSDKAEIEVEMKSAFPKLLNESAAFIDTGSPHHIEFCNDVNQINVVEEGRRIRYSDPYGKAGANVNFVQAVPGGISIRTYERGVEDETLSCGTGVVGSALASVNAGFVNDSGMVIVNTQGGILKVAYTQLNNSFDKIKLIGPVSLVFSGKIEI